MVTSNGRDWLRGPLLGKPYPEVGGGVTVTQLVTPPSTYCLLG